MVSDFAKQIEENIREYLPESYSNAQIEIQNTVKGNDRILEGILIQKEGENSAPVIYMEGFSERYYQGEELADILEEIADTRVSLDERISFDIESLKDYEGLKDKLFIEMCDPEINREFLKGKPYKLVGSLAAVYRVSIFDREEGIASMAVTNAHMSIWGVDTEQLHQDALTAESARGIGLYDLQAAAKECLDPLVWKAENLLQTDSRSERLDEGCIYVLTNESRQYGASAIVNDEIMKRAGEIVGGDYFVLPSSKHEVLLVPDNGALTQGGLEEMVRDVNGTIVSPEDFLSDTVQFYDTKSNELLPEKPKNIDKEQKAAAKKVVDGASEERTWRKDAGRELAR